MTRVAGHRRDHRVDIFDDLMKGQEAIQDAVPLGQLGRLQQPGPGLGPAQHGDRRCDRLRQIPGATGCHSLGSKALQFRSKVTYLHAHNIGKAGASGRVNLPSGGRKFRPPGNDIQARHEPGEIDG